MAFWRPTGWAIPLAAAGIVSAAAVVAVVISAQHELPAPDAARDVSRPAPAASSVPAEGGKGTTADASPDAASDLAATVEADEIAAARGTEVPRQPDAVTGRAPGPSSDIAGDVSGPDTVEAVRAPAQQTPPGTPRGAGSPASPSGLTVDDAAAPIAAGRSGTAAGRPATADRATPVPAGTGADAIAEPESAMAVRSAEPLSVQSADPAGPDPDLTGPPSGSMPEEAPPSASGSAEREEAPAPPRAAEPDSDYPAVTRFTATPDDLVGIAPPRPAAGGNATRAAVGPSAVPAVPGTSVREDVPDPSARASAEPPADVSAPEAAVTAARRAGATVAELPAPPALQNVDGGSTGEPVSETSQAAAGASVAGEAVEPLPASEIAAAGVNDPGASRASAVENAVPDPAPAAPAPGPPSAGTVEPLAEPAADDGTGPRVAALPDDAPARAYDFAGAPEPAAAPAQPAAPGDAPAAATPPEPEGIPPSFDVVRIGPDGGAVFAGRAAPGAEVTIRDKDAVIGRARADRRGEWVILPDEPLAPGTRELGLVAEQPGAQAVESEDVVVMVVPQRDTAEPGIEKAPPVMAVQVARDGTGPSRVLQFGGPDEGLETAEGLTLDTIDYDTAGRLDFSGRAQPHATIDAYLDNKFIGRAQTSESGRWRIRPSEPIPVGMHLLRIEQLDTTGKVISRIETPFSQADFATPTPREDVVIVQPGNSLWRIARNVYGQGVQYTVIYEANAYQIVDPDLIYPGQVFVVPGEEE